jgi:hypothetical protein
LLPLLEEVSIVNSLVKPQIMIRKGEMIWNGKKLRILRHRNRENIELRIRGKEEKNNV